MINSNEVKIEIPYIEDKFERLKRLEEQGVKTIPQLNGWDLIDPIQPPKDYIVPYNPEHK